MPRRTNACAEVLSPRRTRPECELHTLEVFEENDYCLGR